MGSCCALHFVPSTRIRYAGKTPDTKYLYVTILEGCFTMHFGRTIKDLPGTLELSSFKGTVSIFEHLHVADDKGNAVG